MIRHDEGMTIASTYLGIEGRERERESKGDWCTHLLLHTRFKPNPQYHHYIGHVYQRGFCHPIVVKYASTQLSLPKLRRTV